MGNLVLMIFSLLSIILVGTNGQSFPRLHHHGGKMKTLQTKPKYMEQPISHFEDLGKTWKQMYMEAYMPLNHKGLKNNVAFLSVGGEGPGCGFDGMMSEWAPLHNASQFCLEHRYYGSSRPFPEQTVENLKYLSSREMIGDLKYFIEYINKENEWTGTKWIVFGGSYSGSLAAWLRKLHPETVIGAVASSAPLEARLDFYQFYQVTERSLTSGPGGSVECREKIRKAFVDVVNLFDYSEKGLIKLNQLFKVQPPITNEDYKVENFENFFNYLINNFWNAVQYSANWRDMNIGNVCKMMKKNEDPLDGLSEIASQQWDGEDPPFVNNFTMTVDRLRDITYNDRTIATDRSWTWQTCTEFGFFQTTHQKGIFVGVPSSYFIDMCMGIFGKEFNEAYIQKAIDETNEYFGGINGYNATNVVLINGDVDPWSALGKLKADNHLQDTFLVKGASHCADMSESDDPMIKKVHKTTAKRINQWINGSKE